MYGNLKRGNLRLFFCMVIDNEICVPDVERNEKLDENEFLKVIAKSKCVLDIV